LSFSFSLHAQQFIEKFDGKSSGPPKGWTVQSGSWSLFQGHLVTEGAEEWAFITKNGLQPENCVIDLEVFYYDSGLQFAGGTVRYLNTKKFLFGKVQENTIASKDFDRAFIVERGGIQKSKWADMKKKVATSCMLRFIVAGKSSWLKLDFDKDGIFDQVLQRPVSTLFGKGLVGVGVWGFSEVDNFKFYNLVLQPASQRTQPRIGRTYEMNLWTDHPKTIPWLMALSAKNRGFALGTRRIPINLDGLFYLSIQASGFLGFRGTTNSQGFSRIRMKVPNLTALIGKTFFAAVVSLDLKKPFGVEGISNDLALKFSR